MFQEISIPLTVMASESDVQTVNKLALSNLVKKSELILSLALATIVRQQFYIVFVSLAYSPNQLHDHVRTTCNLEFG